MSVSLWLQPLLGIGSIAIAEVVRDCYHVAGHQWQPLQRWHNLHHRAFRRDLSITSFDIFAQAQLYNDVPEGLFMAAIGGAIAVAAAAAYGWGQTWGLWAGSLYALSFVGAAIARSRGALMWTDLTHEPGPLTAPPSLWSVNRTYHWRHHFDSGNAYFCGTLTLVDKVLGTALSLQGKKIAITGASGTLGQALIRQLLAAGAKPIALTTRADHPFGDTIPVWQWQPGQEDALRDRLAKVDILILNHGTNDPGARSRAAIAQAYEVNAFSSWRFLETFLETVTDSEHRALKEVWVNTSEAEVQPAFSPLYELSKRTLGDLVTLRRLDAPCTIRKLILGPFKSNLNPIGVMDATLTAKAIVALAKRDIRNIIVTINPLTYLTFMPKEVIKSLYFRLCTRRP
ncbi:MAG: hypothetical protein Fur0042_10340 [Cyanophyceae cyanobacterium]